MNAREMVRGILNILNEDWTRWDKKGPGSIEYSGEDLERMKSICHTVIGGVIKGDPVVEPVRFLPLRETVSNDSIPQANSQLLNLWAFAQDSARKWSPNVLSEENGVIEARYGAPEAENFLTYSFFPDGSVLRSLTIGKQSQAQKVLGFRWELSRFVDLLNAKRFTECEV